MPTHFFFRPNPVHYPITRPNTPGAYQTSKTPYTPIYHTRHSVIGNTASSQPVQSNVQELAIVETTTLNLHNNTLTYILVCLGIALVLDIMAHFYRKYRTRGMLARPMNAARRLQEMEAHANKETTILLRNYNIKIMVAKTMNAILINIQLIINYCKFIRINFSCI